MKVESIKNFSLQYQSPFIQNCCWPWRLELWIRGRSGKGFGWGWSTDWGWPVASSTQPVSICWWSRCSCWGLVVVWGLILDSSTGASFSPDRSAVSSSRFSGGSFHCPSSSWPGRLPSSLSPRVHSFADRVPPWVISWCLHCPEFPSGSSCTIAWANHRAAWCTGSAGQHRLTFL